MRLTGGSLKGKKINPKGLGKSSDHGALRATSSKVRESIFNIIGPSIKGAVFADIYAGSGTVGMEAMSRGAKRVYFIEADRKRARDLTGLLAHCGCGDRADIKAMDAAAFIKYSEKAGLKLDIVFLDPPYGSGELDAVIPVLATGGALSNSAIVIAEHSKREALPDESGCLRKQKEYRYGDTILTLYRMG